MSDARMSIPLARATIASVTDELGVSDPVNVRMASVPGRVRKLATAALIALLVGCGRPAPPPSNSFLLVLPAVGGTRRAVEVVVDDRARALDAVAFVTPDVPFPPGPEARVSVHGVPGSDDRVLVRWLGGLCDRRVTLTLQIDPLRRGLRLRHDIVRDRACRLAGIERGVVLDFREPIDPTRIETEWTTT